MINKGNFRITFGDDDEHKNFTVDVCFNDLLVALITQERGEGSIEIEIYPCPDSDRWLFDYYEFMDAIALAKDELVRRK